MEIDRVKFNPEEESNEYWDLLLSYTKKVHLRLYPNEPRISDENNKQQIIKQFNSRDILFDLFLIFEKGKRDKMIALFMIGFYEGNKALGITEINILPEYRQKGIGKILLKELHKIMKEKGIEHIISNSQEEEGKVLINKMGGKILDSNIENRVYLNDVDWDLMDEWINKGEEKNPDATLKVFTQVPDELIKKYIAMQNEMLDQFPSNNMTLNASMMTEEIIREKEEEMTQSGKTKLTAVILTDKILSLTEMIFSQKNLDRIYQGLTFTLPKYEKNGLGKWIKAFMLKFVKENYSTLDFVNSNLIYDNPGLISINTRIGYNLVKRYYTLEISTEQLGIYLNEYFQVLV